MNYLYFILLLQVDIEEKVKNAPDKGYEIGLTIGSYLPYVIFVIIAYIVYHKAKNRKDLGD